MYLHKIFTRRFSRQSSHEVSLESTSKRSEDLKEHSVYTHFPKDRNYAICQRTNVRSCVSTVFLFISSKTEITRSVRWSKSQGSCAEDAMEKSYLEQKIFMCLDNIRSQSSRWKLWISKQSSICNREAGSEHSVDPDISVQDQTSQETQRSLQKFLELNRKLTVIYTDNSLEFDKACEDLSWNHCTSTPHRSETNGIAGRAVRRVKEDRQLWSE